MFTILPDSAIHHLPFREIVVFGLFFAMLGGMFPRMGNGLHGAVSSTARATARARGRNRGL